MEVEGTKLAKIPRSISIGAPDYFTVKLKYNEFINNMGAGTVNGAVQVFRIDSIFDPNLTGVGHQPQSRDLWASMYDFYKVIQCDYKITFKTSSGAGTADSILSIAHSTISTELTGGSYINDSENKQVVKNYFVNTSSSSGTNAVLFIEGSVVPWELDVDITEQNNTRYWTAVGSNPDSGKYLCIANNTLSGVASNVAYMFVEIWYTVQFRQYNAVLRKDDS